jgi:hypothetical protein
MHSVVKIIAIEVAFCSQEYFRRITFLIAKSILACRSQILVVELFNNNGPIYTAFSAIRLNGAKIVK